MQMEEVYSKNFNSVYKYFYYKDVDSEEIEDLTQETFLRYYKKYDSRQLQEQDAIKILYIIARNIWKEWLRNLSRTRTEELFETMGYGEATKDFDDRDLGYDAWEHERQALLVAIQDFNPTLRSVLTLRFLEGKTRKEIATSLGIKEDHVHTYQKRGVKMLQKIASRTVPPQSYTK